MSAPPSNRLVFFGASGDLAYKQIFPALQAMTGHGHLDMPVYGVARADYDDARFVDRAQASIREHGQRDDAAFAKLAGNLHYVRGDYNADETYARLKTLLGEDARPLFYLAIPPQSFEAVIKHLASSGLNRNARVVVEKPFGRDLRSAQDLNRMLREVLPDDAIFRVDHFLGKEPVQNLLYFRFANRFVDSLWNRHEVASVQVTMAESFGVQGRGAFYDDVGAIRDVIQNHLFQLLAILACDAAAASDGAIAHPARVELLNAIRPLSASDLVRGQFAGYLDEKGVAADSRVETFAALRLAIDNERWRGVPFYIRAGKCLPVTATEVMVRLRPAAAAPFDTDAGDAGNYFRFRLGPEVAIAVGGRIKVAGEAMLGEPVELAEHHPTGDEMKPYERLLADALRGDGSLFASYESIEAAWRVVEPVLDSADRPLIYAPGSWGPAEAQALISDGAGWHDPVAHEDEHA